MTFDELPSDIQEQFFWTGQKGDWTPAEAYEHLVPEHLRDHPDEIRSFMNGNPALGVEDKDVSRIISGHNGGEYSTENTIMEHSSTNRSYGAENMTPERYQAAMDLNSNDAQAIESHYTQDTMNLFEDTTVVETAAEAGLLETAFEGLIPLGAGIAAAAYVGDKFEKKEERIGFGALAAGAATLVAMTPPGQICIAGYAGYKLVQAGLKVADKLQQEVVKAEA